MADGVEHRGVIEGLSRILRELLRTPRVRETVRILLSELDPENAPLLVRALRSEAPELFLDLLSASPKLVNAALGALCELLAQVDSLPGEMASAFAVWHLDALDARRLGELAGRVVALWLKVSENGERPAAPAFGERFVLGFQGAVLRAGQDADTVVDRLAAAAIRAEAAALARVGRAAARDDSATADALREAAAGLAAFATSHPGLVETWLRPFRELARGAGEPEGGADG